MRDRNRQLYLAAWIAYIVFSMLAIPYLRVTVMLFSVPLTMLGGWLYRYKGALATIVLTLPYHYLLLSLYSNDPVVIHEAFNPFGIASQLFFSCGTALLKTMELRYRQLNDELELIVEKRTNDLRTLADHLIQREELGHSTLIRGLLDEPIEQMERLLETSNLLSIRLQDHRHPVAEHARTINMHIRDCIKQTSELRSESFAADITSSNIRQSLETLANRMMRMGGSGLNILVEGNWDALDQEIILQVYSIISEAVTNAMRHAEATNIAIRCIDDSDPLRIQIENNGRRFPRTLNEGMGIPLMRYRAMRIGGTLSISEGIDDMKTIVVCSIPAKAIPNQTLPRPLHRRPDDVHDRHDRLGHED